MPLLKTPQKIDLANLDVAGVDSRLVVLLVTCVLAKSLDRSAKAVSKAGFQYVPALRNTHAKAVLSNLPKVLAKVGTVHRDLLHEMAKLLRNGPALYLKQAVRELAALFAED